MERSPRHEKLRFGGAGKITEKFYFVLKHREDYFMKKVFISQPMRGLTSEQILQARDSIKEEVLKKYGDKDIEFLSSFFDDYNGSAVGFLGKSIEVMSHADIVVFGKGWAHMRGCRIEEAIAKEYEIERYYANV
jgi:hypothetical protein